MKRARELARQAGTTTTKIVEDALRHYEHPTAPQDQSDKERWAAIHAIMDRASKRGPFPTMKEIDEEMYDEWGLPR